MQPAPWLVSAADIDWQADGAPVSRQFGDVYFSRDNGLAESRHVFLAGNALEQRLAQLASRQCFVIAETGFGTGLNLLALWQLWQRVRPDNQSRLHFVSVERFPLTRADLATALQLWPELAALSTQLLAQYPPLLPGVHRLIFEQERLTVDLWWGDAALCLQQMTTVQPVDAWFLDGFAPACNADLWQETVLQPIARLSGPKTTLASFSVAGVVKRGLRAVGATVQRTPGYGRKREMLRAHWSGVTDPVDPPTLLALIDTATRPVAVIGCGIAGLSLAWALSRRGYAVDLYDEAPLSGASGNPRALLVPKLTPLAHVATHLHTTGWLSALRWWQQLCPQAVEKYGAQLLQADDRLADYPAEILQPLLIDPTDTSFHSDTKMATIGELSNMATQPDCFLPNGAMLIPERIADAILNRSQVRLLGMSISHVKQFDGGWRLSHDQGNTDYDQVILANALQAKQLFPALPALTPIRGQISACASDWQPPHILSYGGYCAPLTTPGNSMILLGASFTRHCSDQTVTLADHQHNLELLAAVAPEQARQLPPVDSWIGRASIRAQTRDYLPLCGEIKPGLWVLAGLGSKGFAFAPVCAEMLVSTLLGEPLPLPAVLVSRLRPQRLMT